MWARGLDVRPASGRSGKSGAAAMTAGLSALVGGRALEARRTRAERFSVPGGFRWPLIELCVSSLDRSGSMQAVGRLQSRTIDPSPRFASKV
jgi:hypothetical protein